MHNCIFANYRVPICFKCEILTFISKGLHKQDWLTGIYRLWKNVFSSFEKLFLFFFSIFSITMCLLIFHFLLKYIIYKTLVQMNSKDF